MKTKFWQKGQSLVEIALVLPMFLIIIAGVVEVSHLLITKNRVESAARAAARFAAAGGSEPDVVVLNTVTQTLDLSSGVWDIWLVEATVNNDGDDFTVWSVESIYGDHKTVLYTETQAYIDCEDPEECLRTQVLVELQTDENGVHHDPEANPTVERIAANLQVVGVMVIHDVNSILGLDAIPGLRGWNSVQAFAMMRVTNPFEANAGNGCDPFPIAVYYGNRSLTDTIGGNPYPTNFDYPSNPPAYNTFYRNVPQVPLAEAQEGYIYLVQDGDGNGSKGWLAWNEGISSDATTLADSLGWPGNATDYTDHNDGGQPATPLYPHVVRGYVNPIDNLDLALHIGDWVVTRTGSTNSDEVRDITAEHVALNGRQLRLVVWDELSEGNGDNLWYRVKGFIIAKLHGYHLSQSSGDSWILIEFIRWDNSCGQPGVD